MVLRLSQEQAPFVVEEAMQVIEDGLALPQQQCGKLELR